VEVGLQLEADAGQPRWRLKVYAMENDPAKLLQVVGRDFPERRRMAGP